MINYVDKLEQLKSSLKDKEEFSAFLSDISLPFIPAFDASFENSKNKTVLVGQETAGWRKKRKLKDLVCDDYDISTHISDSQNRYLELYGDKTQAKYPFLKFLNQIKKHTDVVQWLNFYICDYKQESFNNLNSKKKNIELYQVIKDFSISNLVNQLTQLKPKNIIFVGQYHGNWPQLKAAYVSQEEIINVKESNKNFSLRFWNNETLVIRVPHPAAKGVKGKKQLLDRALYYYQVFNQDADQDIEKFKALIADDIQA